MKEGVDYKIEYQNAGFDDNAATQIAQNFSAKNVALMCAIATPSATACYAAAEDKDIPVIFTAITDPEEAKLTPVATSQAPATSFPSKDSLS